jgi:hypothetical protein
VALLQAREKIQDRYTCVFRYVFSGISPGWVIVRPIYGGTASFTRSSPDPLPQSFGVMAPRSSTLAAPNQRWFSPAYDRGQIGGSTRPALTITPFAMIQPANAVLLAPSTYYHHWSQFSSSAKNSFDVPVQSSGGVW